MADGCTAPARATESQTCVSLMRVRAAIVSSVSTEFITFLSDFFFFALFLTVQVRWWRWWPKTFVRSYRYLYSILLSAGTSELPAVHVDQLEVLVRFRFSNNIFVDQVDIVSGSDHSTSVPGVL